MDLGAGAERAGGARDDETPGFSIRSCFRGVFLLQALIAPDALGAPPTGAVAAQDTRAAAMVRNMPMDFVANRGQWKDPAKFVVWKGAMVAAFDEDAIRFYLGEDRSPSLRLAFEDASTDSVLEGDDRRSGQYNFFFGNDPRKWQSNVTAYAGVLYRGLYEGIDLRVREEAGQLEYDLLLAPGADLTQVVIRADGASSIELASDGSLILNTASGSLTQTAPKTWEELATGEKRLLASRVRKLDAHHFGFEVPDRDPRLAMVIDPGLDWSTYLGGSLRDVILDVALARDGTGDLVVVGQTHSFDFPASSGSMGVDSFLPFVARFDSTGSTLVYATLFGSPGIHGEFVNDLALDASSGPIIVGSTRSPDLPTTPGALDTTYNGGTSNTDDAFVARFDPSGSQLVFSTYLGVAPLPDPNNPSGFLGGAEEAHRVAVDPAGGIVVAGFTISPNFPTTAGAFDRTLAAGSDLFVARLSADGSQLTYSTFLGGDGGERVTDLVVDVNGFVTLTGRTLAETGEPFPTTPDALRRNHAGGIPTHGDSYLARLELSGAGPADLRYSTIFPGESSDETKGLALHPTDPELVTVVGLTRSFDFPTTPGAVKRIMVSPTDWQVAFASQFRFPAAGGGGLLWSTLLGGPGFQGATGVAVESGGHVVVGGWGGMDFPTTQGSYDRLGTSQDGFLARLGPDGKTLDYATLFGGAKDEDGLRVLSLAPRSAVVSGWTESIDLPTTPGAFDRVFASNGTNGPAFAYDGFLARFSLEPGSTTDTTAAPPTLVSPANGAAFPAPTDVQQTTVTFDWSDVSDPAGVQSYQLEVSPDPDFFLNRLNVAEWTVREPTASQIDVSFVHFLGHQGTYSWRVRTLDGANNWSPWSAVRTLSLGVSAAPRLSHARLDRVEVTGGGTAQGTVVLQNRPAPAGGFTIFLSSSNPAIASVPASVVVPSGADRANFTVTTSAVTRSTPVLITVHDTGLPDTPVLWVYPGAPGPVALAALALTPTSVVGGTSSTGTVTLSAAAPSGGAAVSLSDNSSATTVPASVTVPAGATSANFTVTTTSVTASTSATISAVFAGVTRTAALTVNPSAPPTPAVPALISPAADATPAQPVTFDWNDVANAANYEIQIDNSSTISAPFTASQSVSASQLTIGGLPAQRLWWRGRAKNSAGVFGPFSSTRRFTPQAAPAAASLSSVSVNPTSVVGGNASTGTATLTAAAPSGGAVVTLLSSNTPAATVPASVTVPAGAASATFTVTTTSVSASTTVTLTGTYNGTSRTATLTVTAVPAPASLNTLALNPTSVTGGGTSQGTVTLTSAAPAGGAVVTLSDNSTAATVPASVTVAAGATSASFTVTTTAVTALTPVTISAVFADVTRTAALTVTPPGTTVTLTVTATGRNGERITSSPAGINVAVGSTQSASFAANSSITLSVTNGRDAIWSGACSSGGNKTRTCTFTITGNASVSANVQ